MNRRNFLRQGLGITSGLITAAYVPFTLAETAGQTGISKPNYYLNDFNLPALDEGQTIQGKQVFKLALQQGETRILADKTTKTIGINQDFLAPVLRMKKGQVVRMEVTNNLSETAALHWHGMVLPASEDGGPHQAIQPSKTWVAEWKILNEASTLFYHSHTHNQTGQQVWRGLGGQMQIVDEDQDAELGIPHEYGIDDYPVILMDRAFDESGEFYYSNTRMNKMLGMHGDVMLVNGVANSVLKPKKTLVRLRLHNASNARFYDLVFSDNRAFQLIASDGGLLERSYSLRQIRLAPGERAEIIVDLSDRKPITLKTIKGYGNLSMRMGMMGGNSASDLDQDFNLLHIDPSQSERSAAFKTTQLVTLPDWSKVEVAQTRQMNLEMQMGPRMMFGSGGFTINGQAMNMNVINEVAHANTFELWELHNPSMMHHPFHVHNTQFRVLDRNGQAPYPWERGYKDVVTVHKDETIRILFPTGPYRDELIPYMYHCHILEHEDAGMMGQFTVV
ncbi:MAG: multicopper oxidase domain-containing protein [Thiomicrospira sp.]|uniref:multicopper oxidase family protein n=1 Tax=Thiomicrospira sp. TaxID=935 RepID=UPI001A05A003|nr:multicopper oxidase domain-containing protein [Thiomicrospira sp.]MBE0494634.1 multicopper oxidase domain-containing protein [Thiomicrospira sp.]